MALPLPPQQSTPVMSDNSPTYLGARSFTTADVKALIRLTPATLALHLSEGTWIPANHLTMIALEVAIAISQGNHNLIIGAPPRHGKSELLSYWTPVWALDRRPTDTTILTGYGADLVRGFSRRIRDTISYWTNLEEDRDYLHCPLKSDSKNVDAWNTEAGGGLYAVGIGGAILGRGAHLFIIDDYIKNVKEAESPTVLKDIWDWFRGVTLSRLEPNAVQLIVASRWSRQDLVGRILQEEPEQWKVINFPALALEPDKLGPDLLGRSVEMALWPERYSAKHLQKLRKRMGTYLFDAQYQQVPHARTSDSERTNNIPIIDIVPTNPLFRRCRAWDLAASGQKGDLMVGSAMIRDETRKRTIIEDIRTKHPNPRDVENFIYSTAEDDGFDVVILIEQEPGSSGKIWAASLTEKLKGYMVKFVPSSGSKWIRAQPIITAAENERLEIKRAPWNQDFLDEFCDFNGEAGGQDNRVDSVSLGFNYLNSKIHHAGTWGRPKRAVSISNINNEVGPARGQLIVGPVFGRNRR